MFGTDKNTNNYARIGGGSIIGICVFAILPFVQYYGHINRWPPEYAGYAGLIAIISGLGASLVLIKFISKKSVAVSFLCIFAALTSIRFGFENPIEKKIASTTGFYNNPSPISQTNHSNLQPGEKLSLSNSGYAIQLPSDLDIEIARRDLDFTAKLNLPDKSIVQINAGCFDTAKPGSNIPETAINIINGYDTDHKPQLRCYRKNESLNACLIQLDDRENQARWILLARNTNQDIGISITIEFDINHQSTRSYVPYILNSLTRDDTIKPACPQVTSTSSMLR